MNEICGQSAFGEVYSFDGTQAAYFRDFQYASGRDERISHIEYSNETCLVKIDGRTCNSCELKNCASDDSSSVAPYFDCKNIEEGVVFDACAVDQVGEAGVFEYFLDTKSFICIEDSPEENPSMQTCIELVMEKETGTSGMVSCSCSESATGATLNCDDQCEYCSFKGDICMIRNRSSTIDSDGTIIGTFDNYRYIRGRDDKVSIERFDCESDTGICGSCRLVVDNLECDSCGVILCENMLENQIGGLQVSCTSLEDGLAFSSCDPPMDIEAGVFGFLSTIDFDICKLNAMEACLPFSAAEEAQNAGVTCACTGNKTMATLECFDQECLYCNDEATTCAAYVYGAEFDSSGEPIQYFDTIRYKVGRADQIRYGFLVDGGCMVHVNGKLCNSCEVSVCRMEDEFGNIVESTGYSINCANLEDSEMIDTCQDSIDTTSIFQLFGKFEYQQCHNSSETAESLCNQELAGIDLSNLGSASCECSEEKTTSNFLLKCEFQDCLFCNDDLEVCGYKTDTIVFGSFGTIFERGIGFQYVEGGSDHVAYYEFNKPLGEGVTCRAELNGKVCSKCEIELCQPTNDKLHGYWIECQNLFGGAAFSQCDEGSVDGAFQFESFGEYEFCYDRSDPADVCYDARISYESVGGAFGTTCACLELDASRKFALSCADLSCSYCNSDRSICALRVAYGTRINSFGLSTGFYETFNYITGIDDVLLVEDTASGCKIAVNGQVCSSCTTVTCTDEASGFTFGGFAIDCSNVAQGLSHTCGKGASVFQAVDDPSFGECLPFNGTFPPTVAPTDALPGSMEPSMATTAQVASLPPTPNAEEDGRSGEMPTGDSSSPSSIL